MAEKKSIFAGIKETKGAGFKNFSTLDASRWSFGFRMFRAHIGKIILMNFLLVVSLVPALILLLMRMNILSSIDAPFSSNLGTGYMPFPEIAGVVEATTLVANVRFFSFLPLAAIPFGAALAGVLFVMRNLFWLEDVRLFRDLGRGIKRNWAIIVYTVIYAAVVSVCFLAISYSSYNSSVGEARWYHTFTKVVCYIVIALVSLTFMNGAVMSVTYKVKFFGLIKNSLLISIILIPLHLFFAVIAFAPVLIVFLGGMLGMIGLILILFAGLSYAVLVWTDYPHWIYEKFMPAPVNSAPAKSPESKKKEKYDEEEKSLPALYVQTSQLSVKPLTADDFILPSLPPVFTIDEVNLLEQKRNEMRADSDEFSRAHETQAEKKPEEKAPENNAAKAETKKRAKHKKH